VENAQKPCPRNLPVKTGLTSGLFFDGSGKCLLAHLLVRVTLTNHRRLCLVPTDYAIRHTVDDGQPNFQTRVGSSRRRARGAHRMCKAAVRNWVEIEPRVRDWANRLAKQLRKADALEGNRILVRVPTLVKEGNSNHFGRLALEITQRLNDVCPASTTSRWCRFFRVVSLS
jgi:hypothetical protein